MGDNGGAETCDVGDLGLGDFRITVTVSGKKISFVSKRGRTGGEIYYLYEGRKSRRLSEEEVKEILPGLIREKLRELEEMRIKYERILEKLSPSMEFEF